MKERVYASMTEKRRVEHDKSMRTAEQEVLADIIKAVRELRPYNTELYNSLMYMIGERYEQVKKTEKQ